MASRVQTQRAVFENRCDWRYFLSLAARELRRGRIEIDGYCLMGNHFHLLISSPNGEFDRASGTIQNKSVYRFNREQSREVERLPLSEALSRMGREISS